MDAVKYFEEKERMLNSLGRTEDVCFGVKCDKCCFRTEKGCVVHEKESVEIVEKWSEEHPQKTILQDFLEKYPNAKLHGKGCPSICVNHLGYKEQSCYDPEINYDCFKCWSRPLEG